MFDLKSKLRRTREGLVSPLVRVFGRKARLSAEDEDSIEELLLSSDMGVEACERIMEDLRSRGERGDPMTFLRDEFLELLGEGEAPTDPPAAGPQAVLVIGVNGVGKTTSIAKLANHYRNNGKSVVLAAADTFRAAAQDQLARWAERIGVEIIGHDAGGDPAAVAYDACEAAKSREIDMVIVDTAGRLHTRVNLMEELKKIERSCAKVLGEGAVRTYLTLDATLGQNSLHQAAEFTRNVHADGIILTKLDSTAKGGIVIAIKHTLGIPVRFIGLGEAVDDFAEFVPAQFVDALLAG